MHWPHIHLESIARVRFGPRAFGLYVAAVTCTALTSAIAFFAVPQLADAPAARPGAAPNVIVAVPPHSRVPKPRPDEPATTGSIAPASLAGIPPQPAPIEGALARRAEELREKAVLIAASWQDCDQIESAEPLTSASGFLTVRVACANGTSAYLDEAEIEAIRPPVAPLSLAAALRREIPEDAPTPHPEPLSDAAAVTACEENVRLGLPMPGSLIRIRSSTGVDRAPGENAVVRFDFSALNGLGFPLALKVLCVFDQKELARLQVTAR